MDPWSDVMVHLCQDRIAQMGVGGDRVSRGLEGFVGSVDAGASLGVVKTPSPVTYDPNLPV